MRCGLTLWASVDNPTDAARNGTLPSAAFLWRFGKLRMRRPPSPPKSLQQCSLPGPRPYPAQPDLPPNILRRATLCSTAVAQFDATLALWARCDIFVYKPPERPLCAAPSTLWPRSAGSSVSTPCAHGLTISAQKNFLRGFRCVCRRSMPWSSVNKCKMWPKALLTSCTLAKAICDS